MKHEKRVIGYGSHRYSGNRRRGSGQRAISAVPVDNGTAGKQRSVIRRSGDRPDASMHNTGKITGQKVIVSLNQTQKG